jgi:hypothetical protein
MVALWLTIAADLILRMVSSIEEQGQARPWQSCAFALVITAGMLTKGLIGLVFPVGLLILYLAITGNLRMLRRMRPLLGLAVLVVTALPWHLLAAIQNPPSGEAKGWFWFYFINDQINRYLNKRIPRDYDKVPLGMFWSLLVVWLMPWGLFLLGVARSVSRAWWTRRQWRQPSPRLLFVLWAAMILLFFSFSTRQEYYTIPAVPALALLVGIFLAEEEQGLGVARHVTRLWGRIAAGILFAIGLLAAIVCGYFALVARPPAPGVELYQAIVENPAHYALSFGHMYDLTSASMGFFRGPLLGTAIGMLLGTGLAFFLRLRRRYYAANLALTAAMCLILGCVHQAYRTFYPILGSQPLAAAISRDWRPGALIVVDGQYSDASSVGFYTGQPLYMLNGRVNNLWYGSLFADAPHRFEDDASFAHLWYGPQQVFFITGRPGVVKTLVDGGGRIIASTSGRSVLVNHPGVNQPGVKQPG